MVDKSIIPHLKSACCALGIMELGKAIPIALGGTGFIVDPEGWVVTADHVTRSLGKKLGELKEENDKFEAAAFLIQDKDEKSGRFLAIPIKAMRGLEMKIEGLENFLPKNQDIAVGKFIGDFKDLPYLKFQKPQKLNIWDEIFMCGYPGAYDSLNLLDKDYGVRTSPIIQGGRIASLWPNDKAKIPTGIQTDIVGTGGSSGSPLVNADNGEVIGIAQNVISSEVMDQDENEPRPIGFSKMGLVRGISTYYIYDAIPKMIHAMKKFLDERGVPLEGVDDPENLTILDEFKFPNEN